MSCLLIVLLTFKNSKQYRQKIGFCRIAKKICIKRKLMRVASGVLVSTDLEAAMMEEFRPP